MLAAAVTVSGGGSRGLESPSALLGASFGQILGDRLPRLRGARAPHVDDRGRERGHRGGVLVAGGRHDVRHRVPFRRDADLTRLVPAAVAAGAAYLTRAALVGPSHLGGAVGDAAPRRRLRARACALVAIGCGAGGWLFARATGVLRKLGRQAGAVPRADRQARARGARVRGARARGTLDHLRPGLRRGRLARVGRSRVDVLAATMLIRTAGTLACVFGAGGGGVFTSLAVTGVFVSEIVMRALDRGEQLPAAARRRVLSRRGLPHPARRDADGRRATGSLTLTVIGLFAVATAQVMMGENSVSDAKRDTRDAGGA